ncbi:MAG: helix-turn-helix domain-containing protein [Ginsengibacter sp.]
MLTYNEVPAGITEILHRMESMETSLARLISNHKPQQPDSYITRQEAADTLHITLPTLLTWTMDGKIKGYRIGRRVLYKKNEINEAVTSINVRKGGNPK